MLWLAFRPSKLFCHVFCHFPKHYTFLYLKHKIILAMQISELFPRAGCTIHNQGCCWKHQRKGKLTKIGCEAELSEMRGWPNKAHMITDSKYWVMLIFQLQVLCFGIQIGWILFQLIFCITNYGTGIKLKYKHGRWFFQNWSFREEVNFTKAIILRIFVG